MKKLWKSSLFFFTSFVCSAVSSQCHLAPELQGEYISQWLGSEEVAYTKLSVLSNSIDGFGSCKAQLGNRYLFSFSERADTKVATQECRLTCLQLDQLSPSVIKIKTLRKSLDLCTSDNLQTAVARCLLAVGHNELVSYELSSELQRSSINPSRIRYNAEEQKEDMAVMLFKTRSYSREGQGQSRLVGCPFVGRWTFSYKNRWQPNFDIGPSHTTDDEPMTIKCARSLAEICPLDYGFNLYFRGCQVETEDEDIVVKAASLTGDRDIAWQCLAAWKGDDGQNYVAFLDTNLAHLGEKPKPRYRCAIYEQNVETGKVKMALSNDSTCHNQLISAGEGHEMFTMTPFAIKEDQFQGDIRTNFQPFPDWMQGEWSGDVNVNGSTMIYRSIKESKTYTLNLIESMDSDIFKVSLGTACTDRQQICLQIRQKTENIMELQMNEKLLKGEFRNKKSNENDANVMSSNFEEDHSCKLLELEELAWTSHGRILRDTQGSCPVSGVYSARIPRSDGLCAKLSSSCQRKDMINYKVFRCEDENDIIENRLYQCYGKFFDTGTEDGLVERHQQHRAEDPEAFSSLLSRLDNRSSSGLMYTLTRRLDVNSYTTECFVGLNLPAKADISFKSSSQEVAEDADDREVHFVAELGPYCDRSVDPRTKGMMMIKESDSSCHIQEDGLMPSAAEEVDRNAIWQYYLEFEPPGRLEKLRTALEADIEANSGSRSPFDNLLSLSVILFLSFAM